MPGRDPNYTTGHLCRFCGELVPWGTILRLIRTDPDTPGYMLLETACHTACLEGVLRPRGRAELPPPLGGQGAAARRRRRYFHPLPWRERAG